MNKTVNLKVYYLIIAGLIISNILLVAILFFAPNPNQRPPHPEHPGEGPKYIIIERLGFSPEQVAKYENQIDDHRAQIREKEDELMEQKEALYEGLKSGTAIEKQDSLFKIINATQMQIEKIHYAHFLDIKKLCNTSQLEKYNELAEDFAHLFSKKRHRR
jgi:periplasmic protein CpxP/Spy